GAASRHGTAGAGAARRPAARRGARHRGALRRPRDRADRARQARRARDRRGGRPTERRDRRHGRAPAATQDAAKRHLRQDRRLRAQACGVPGDGRRRPPRGRVNRGYRQTVLLLGLLFVGIGIGLIVQTARAGGGVGYVIGVLFVGLGVGRVYLQRRR